MASSAPVFPKPTISTLFPRKSSPDLYLDTSQKMGIFFSFDLIISVKIEVGYFSVVL
jgi:hypothetical protein